MPQKETKITLTEEDVDTLLICIDVFTVETKPNKKWKDRVQALREKLEKAKIE